MCNCNQTTRIEVLPTGEKVFYVDIGGMSPPEVTRYMNAFAERMQNPKYPDEMNYFIPIRPAKCECVNNYNCKHKSEITMEVVFVIVVGLIAIISTLAS